MPRWMDLLSGRRQQQMKEPSSKLTSPFYMGLTVDTAENSRLIPRDHLVDTFKAEPLVRKVITKINRDIFHEGWSIESKDDKTPVDQDLVGLCMDFDRRCRTKQLLELAGISSCIYGDGYLEEMFIGENEDVPSDAPVSNGLGLAKLGLIDAAYIKDAEQKNRKDPTVYYIYQKSSGKQYWHPDRLIHVIENLVPGRLFGYSTILGGYQILCSKLTADESYGKFIEWAGAGVIQGSYENASPDDIKELERRLPQRKEIIWTDEKTKMTVLNPTMMSPGEYNDYFYVNIAALGTMPQHLLTGVQPGQLTGSEIGLADYYKNITNLQVQVFTPVLERIYTDYLRGEGKDFTGCEISWNPIYIDEGSEAAIFLQRAQAGALLLDRGSITSDEYRLICREGIEKLSGEPLLMNPAPTMPAAVSSGSMTKIMERPVAGQQDAECIRLERERGKIEELQQELRLKEAETKEKKRSRKV